jgi:exosortase/archaeosortase family protein
MGEPLAIYYLEMPSRKPGALMSCNARHSAFALHFEGAILFNSNRTPRFLAFLSFNGPNMALIPFPDMQTSGLRSVCLAWHALCLKGFHMTPWTAKPMTMTGENPGRQPSHVPPGKLALRNAVTGLKRDDFIFLGVLMAGAIWIWVRDLAWLSAVEETLPVLAALPLFIWLSAPWRFKEATWSLPFRSLVTAALLVVAGWALDMTLLLAAGWAFALWTWIHQRVSGEVPLLRRLAVLPLMAFPWVTLDLMPVGWWFRLSASWVADHAYSAAGFSVLREGTNLVVSGIPIEVAAPCSGMNSLQAILMGGLVLTWIEFGKSRWYWWIAASLPLLAWTANTIRVCSIIAMAVGLGPDAARGSLHQIGGWAVVLAVIGGWSLMAKRLTGLQNFGIPQRATQR